MSSALTEPSKFKSWYRKNDIAITPWLFLLPAVLFFAIYVIVPIGQSLNMSLKWDGYDLMKILTRYVEIK